MANFKLTDEQIQALKNQVFGHYNVRHEFRLLDEDDMRREQPCSNAKSNKCSGEKATWIRANKLYCEACKKRCDKERSKIVANRAGPALKAATEFATSKTKYEEVMAKYN